MQRLGQENYKGYTIKYFEDEGLFHAKIEKSGFNFELKSMNKYPLADVKKMAYNLVDDRIKQNL